MNCLSNPPRSTSVPENMWCLKVPRPKRKMWPRRNQPRQPLKRLPQPRKRRRKRKPARRLPRPRNRPPRLRPQKRKAQDHSSAAIKRPHLRLWQGSCFEVCAKFSQQVNESIYLHLFVALPEVEWHILRSMLLSNQLTKKPTKRASNIASNVWTAFPITMRVFCFWSLQFHHESCACTYGCRPYRINQASSTVRMINQKNIIFLTCHFYVQKICCQEVICRRWLSWVR